jgi:hypothetical protein
VFELIDNKQVIELFELILQEYKKNQPERFELLPLYLTTLLTEFKLQEKSAKISSKCCYSPDSTLQRCFVKFDL